MEHNEFSGPGATMLSVISAIIAWISLKEMQVIVTFGASCMAIISGFFAARYYWYAAKEKKKRLKQKL